MCHTGLFMQKSPWNTPLLCQIRRREESLRERRQSSEAPVGRWTCVQWKERCSCHRQWAERRQLPAAAYTRLASNSDTFHHVYLQIPRRNWLRHLTIISTNNTVIKATRRLSRFHVLPLNYFFPTAINSPRRSSETRVTQRWLQSIIEIITFYFGLCHAL